jgi:hypothetical protein
MRAAFATEDGLQTFHIQTGTAAVHHCLEQQIHMAAQMKNQIPAVFNLIN